MEANPEKGRTMAPLLLGIDFGTGGAKACIMDAEGHVLAYAYREYPISHRRPGWSEHDPETYWRATCELVGEVLRESRSLPEQIAGAAISSALPSMVLVDEQIRPVAPALNLMDRRATGEVLLIRETLGDALIEEVTANRIEDHPSIVNLLWYKRNEPDTYSRTHKALTIDGFIVARLTGQTTLNVSSAAFYGVAYDIRNSTFRPELLERIGVLPDLIPRLCDCTEVIGEVSAAAAEATGLLAGTPVVGGQVDCNAGWIAGGAVEPGDAQVNLGTSGVLGVVHQNMDYLSSPEGLRMVNIPYTTSPRDTFSAVAVTTTGGQALRYLRDTFGRLETDVERMLGVSSYDLLTLQARDIPAGSAGLIALPYLMGERSPIWDTSARGVLFGLSLHHTRGHIFRAFMEGVAYALFDSFSVLRRTGIKINEPIVFNEGGAKSEVWRKIITDVFGLPTALVADRTGAPRGDAILAGVGVGILPDFKATAEWSSYRDHLEPDPRNHEVYAEYFELYKDLYPSLQSHFAALRSIGLRQK